MFPGIHCYLCNTIVTSEDGAWIRERLLFSRAQRARNRFRTERGLGSDCCSQEHSVPETASGRGVD